MNVILASGSPRRKHLLGLLQIPFEVIPSAVDERSPQSGENPREYALTLARLKASDVAGRYPDRVILASDTVVAIGADILGKPLHADDAERMLRLLRGREHLAATAVVVTTADTTYEGVRSADVAMREYSDNDIRQYIATGEPMDKAGAYAIQGLGGALVACVSGCGNAVIGLPLCLTAQLLIAAGVSIPGNPSDFCPHKGHPHR